MLFLISILNFLRLKLINFCWLFLDKFLFLRRWNFSRFSYFTFLNFLNFIRSGLILRIRNFLNAEICLFWFCYIRTFSDNIMFFRNFSLNVWLDIFIWRLFYYIRIRSLNFITFFIKRLLGLLYSSNNLDLLRLIRSIFLADTP